jgi:hypothetical protein
MLAAGLVANSFVRPLPDKWFMKEEDVAVLQARAGADAKAGERGAAAEGDAGRSTHRRRVYAEATIAWLLVGVPIAWGVWMTLQKTFVLFR